MLPHMITVVSLAVLLALLKLLARRLRLPELPLRLSLLALLVALVASSLPAAWLPPAMRPWLVTLDELLVGLVLIRLLAWALLEAPPSLGWWPATPRIARDLSLLLLGGIYVLAILQQQARVNLVGLVTTSAVLTAVLGLAAQETLKDLFAGIAMQFDPPFHEGDWIDLVGMANGKVVSLNLMNTRLICLDGAEVVLPNSKVAQDVLRRFGPRDPVGNRFRIGLDYALPPAIARELILGVVRQHPRVFRHPPPQVWVSAYEESAISYEILVFQDNALEGARLELRGELLGQIWYRLSREGHSIPYPVRELRLRRKPVESSHSRNTSLEEQLEILRRNQLFQGMSLQQLELLAPRTRCLHFGPGESIVIEGEPGNALYQLVSGAVEVLKDDGHGGAHRVAQLKPDDIFGEMSLCIDAPRSATVRATEESVLLEVERRDLVPLLESDPALLDQLARLVSARQAQLNQLSSSAAKQRENALLQNMRQLFATLLS
ncbi:cyclic nucleotide-binding domain-containing protein [Vulcanococcus limneticus]|uniref:cyclic nucleotide-binding domain-containing protein n=1 Tax=Vulcanococcus limneticus TaxID=2170428 RepID=UPI00398C160E